MSDKLFAWSVVADKTDVTIPFRLISTAGAAVTGKVASDLTLSYWRQGGTRTSISASDLAAVNSSHSDGGVKEVDATNFPGLYRLDLPDAAVASGADWVCIGVVCSGAMDYETWLPIQSSGTVEIYSRIGAPAGASVSADIAALPTAASIWSYGTRTLTSLTALAASIASAIWDAVASSYNTASTMGAKLNTAGGAADPLTNSVPGSYTQGSAGYALGRIGSGTITTVAPVASDNTVTIIRGDDYNASDSRALTWTDTDGNWTTITGATITFACRSADGVSTLSTSGTVVSATQVRVALTAAQTRGLIAGQKYTYDVQATLATSSRIATLARGTLIVQDDIAI